MKTMGAIELQRKQVKYQFRKSVCNVRTCVIGRKEISTQEQREKESGAVGKQYLRKQISQKFPSLCIQRTSFEKAGPWFRERKDWSMELFQTIALISYFVNSLINPNLLSPSSVGAQRRFLRQPLLCNVFQSTPLESLGIPTTLNYFSSKAFV